MTDAQNLPKCGNRRDLALFFHRENGALVSMIFPIVLYVHDTVIVYFELSFALMK